MPGKIERKKPEKKKAGLAKEEGGTAAEKKIWRKERNREQTEVGGEGSIYHHFLSPGIFF